MACVGTIHFMYELPFNRVISLISKKLPDGLIFKSKLRNLLGIIPYQADCIDTVSVLLKLHKPVNLCDVGAYKGYWTYVLHRLNPKLKHAVLIEPQKELYKDLVKIPLGDVHKVIYSCGLGDKKGFAFIKGGSPSASFLNASINQFKYFPNTIKREKEKVAISTLDYIYATDKLPQPDTIKLDVQGFELNVLRGGEKTLSKAKYLVIELSFQQFYKSQPPLSDLMRFLEKHNYIMVSHGFELRWTKNLSVILQTDGIFKNTRFKS